LVADVVVVGDVVSTLNSYHRIVVIIIRLLCDDDVDGDDGHDGQMCQHTVE
jgi:hypothetical protein